MIAWTYRCILVVLGALAVLVLMVAVAHPWIAKGPPPFVDAGPDRGAASRPVSLRGTIDADMYMKVATAIGAGSRDFTVDSSFGGASIAANLIAQAINASNGSLTATGICYSACALLLVGVKNKFYTADADIEIHGARYRYPLPGQDPDQPARDTVAYLVANGAPPELAEKWGMATNLHRLTASELAIIGVSLRGRLGS
jgi:hypothetical protein